MYVAQTDTMYRMKSGKLSKWTAVPRCLAAISAMYRTCIHKLFTQQFKYICTCTCTQSEPQEIVVSKPHPLQTPELHPRENPHPNL